MTPKLDPFPISKEERLCSPIENLEAGELLENPIEDPESPDYLYYLENLNDSREIAAGDPEIPHGDPEVPHQDIEMSEGDVEMVDQEDPRLQMDHKLRLASYEQLSVEQIALVDMVRLLYDRILVLSCVKAIDRRISLSPEQKKAKMMEILQKYNLPQYIWLLTHNGVAPSSPEESQFKENDMRSHMLLNTVFYPWPSIAKFIREQEHILFQWQVMSYETPQAMEFLDRNVIDFPEATQEEKETHQRDLGCYTYPDPFNLSDIIYKVPWILALEPMASKAVYLHEGICYVSKEKMSGILSSLYLHHLEHPKTKEIYELLDKYILGESRAFYLRCLLYPIFLNKIQKLRLVPFKMADIESKIKSFPPCFRILHDQLNKNHYLEDSSRQQYYWLLHGLQAKAEEVKQYMNNHFSKLGRMIQDFESYEYFVLHNCKKYDGDIDYDIPDCSFNIEVKKEKGYGCPFKIDVLDDIEDLGDRLTEWNIPEEDREDIMEYTERRNCANTCSVYFEALHGDDPTKSNEFKEILNPLDYYAESQNVLQLVNPEAFQDEGNEVDDALFFDRLFQNLLKSSAFRDSDESIRYQVRQAVYIKYDVADLIWPEERIEEWE